MADQSFRHCVITALSVVIIATVFMVGSIVINGNIPFVTRHRNWSIGIYSGDSPLKLSPDGSLSNPVLTPADITDGPADYVADPFMIRSSGVWYLFFEIKRSDTHKGNIGLATSADGKKWVYGKTVLDEPFHLSYPYVFEWNGHFYMIPESQAAGSIRLYKGDPFPDRWRFQQSLLAGRYADSSIVRYMDKWWLFALPVTSDSLHLYYSDDLLGPYTQHPSSPIVKDNLHAARPGGRVVFYRGRLVRFAQDGYPEYGTQVRAFEITELSETAYAEKEIEDSPILKGEGEGWNGKGMHTIDPHEQDDGKWIACVDGRGDLLLFGWRY